MGQSLSEADMKAPVVGKSDDDSQICSVLTDACSAVSLLTSTTGDSARLTAVYVSKSITPTCSFEIAE